MATALFVLGHAGSGKTKFSKKFIKSRMKAKEPSFWCLMDKDTSGDCMSRVIMQNLGLDPNDKDSDQYKEHVRDLEYITCLDIAKDQLKLGINVVLPGPWTKELNNGDLFDTTKLSFPKDTKVAYVYMNTSPAQIRQRIDERMNPRDDWKRQNWDEFAQRLQISPAVDQRGILKINYEDDFEAQEKAVLRMLKTI